MITSSLETCAFSSILQFQRLLHMTSWLDSQAWEEACPIDTAQTRTKNVSAQYLQIIAKAKLLDSREVLRLYRACWKVPVAQPAIASAVLRLNLLPFPLGVCGVCITGAVGADQALLIY